MLSSRRVRNDTKSWCRWETNIYGTDPNNPDNFDEIINGEEDKLDMREITLKRPYFKKPGGNHISLVGGGNIRIFKTNGELVTSATNLYDDLRSSHLELLVEGKALGTSTLTMTYNGSSDTIKITTLKVDLIPDYNHDRKIDTTDRDFYKSGEPYRFWVNGDKDAGDVGRGNLPFGQDDNNANCNDAVVNGRKDLIDFFPVHLKIKQAVDLFPHTDYEYVLCTKIPDSVNILKPHGYTIFDSTLTGSTAGNYLVKDDGKKFEESTIETIPAEGISLSFHTLDHIAADSQNGVILFEAKKVSADNKLIGSVGVGPI